MMDWTLCIICQQNTREPLKCPLNAKDEGCDKTAAYLSFFNRASEFRKLNSLPAPVSFQDVSIDELISNRASWHKSCYLKFGQEKLDRVLKRRERNNAVMDDSQLQEKRPRQHFGRYQCIFCGKEDGQLHQFQTLDSDKSIRSMAADLQDTDLLAKIEGTDLVAIGATYHLPCLTLLRNRHRSKERQHTEPSISRAEESQLEAQAFEDVITYVETCLNEDSACSFKMSSLRCFYENRLSNFGITKQVNKSRFKEQLLHRMPEVQVQSDGYNNILISNKTLQQIMKQEGKEDYEGDAEILVKAANIVRKDIFGTIMSSFNGSFQSKCQQQSVSSSLTFLVSALLNGVEAIEENSDTQACLTISQAIVFNCKKKGGNGVAARHNQQREPPLPLYIGLNVHTQTRSRKLNEKLHKLGISVSYERILEVENQLAGAVCTHFNNNGVVCPPELKYNVFTVGALDNIDHNPSSTTAQGSFHGTTHGTGISLFQLPSEASKDQSQDILQLSDEFDEGQQLPDHYTIVPAIALNKSRVAVPKLANPSKAFHERMVVAKEEEEQWLQHVYELLKKPELAKEDKVAWAAYHASKQDRTRDVHVSRSQLLPLFQEKAATAAMVKHGMDIQRKATEFLNAGQVPVTAVDAPLFALAKFVQWSWPELHGEDKQVVMLGGLHTEMAYWKTIGDYLKGSGWTTALAQSGFAQVGTCDSFLTASHLSRTRHAHQVTAVVLAKLLQDAFLFTERHHEGSSKEIWIQQMKQQSPVFQYWYTILTMELIGLIFVRAHRTHDFSLYVESLKAIAPWFFAFNHHNYARWLPIHIRDMEHLPPSILDEFEKRGHWVIQKTTKRFSAIPVDQAHEQNNELVKGSGGAVGLTENPKAFRRWMIAGPEQARLLLEFEKEYSNEKNDEQHHEEGVTTQATFKRQAAKLAETITEMGNPFLDKSNELVVLDSGKVMPEAVVETVRNVEALGKAQYDEYHKSVVSQCSRSIHEPIKRNSLALFSIPSGSTQSKKNEQLSMLKTDISLFSRLYIVVQHREGNMANFFRHENHPYPPSLSDNGKLRLGKKSDLIKCIESSNENAQPPSFFDVKVLDGAAVVHMLSPNGVTTFEEYANQVFVPHIAYHLKDSNRVDLGLG